MNHSIRSLVLMSWTFGSVLLAGTVFQAPAQVVTLPGLGPAVPGKGPALSGPLPSPGQGINDPQDAGTIRTVAGGSVGDGEPAIDAGLVLPNDLAVDRDGNLYISDGSNNRVRRVDALTGRISTVAGSGGRGFSGDGVRAVDAELSVNYGIALDSFGNLYIADRNNHRIRRVDALTGTITTAVGTSPPGFSGDGGPAEEAQLGVPQDIAIDRAGNLFIADRGNHRIRMVDASTGRITTIAGNGTAGSGGDGGSALAAQLGTPESIALDSAGNLYVTTGHRIRRIDAGTGLITTVSGSGFGFSGDGGPAADALFNDPQGLAVDAQGNLFVADRDNHRIRKIDIQSGSVTTLAGSGEQGFSGDEGPATMARFTAPEGILLDGDGGLLIADRSNHRIRKVDLQTGIIETVTGGVVGDGRPAVDARLALPRKTAMDGAGNLYIVDRSHDRIRRVDAETGLISTVAGTGIRGFAGDGGPATSARFWLPFGLALDPLTESLLIADEINHRIRKVDLKTGLITTVAGTGISGFFGDGGPATLAQLDNPEGVAVDGSGNLYVADSDNHRIRRIGAATGIITTVAGTEGSGFSGDNGPATEAALNSPRDVVLDSGGNLFFADRVNHRCKW